MDVHYWKECPMLTQCEKPDDSICQFCGRQDPGFSAGGGESMDVHYWKECPMLTQCELCSQVIEISTLYHHLAGECEHGDAAKEKARDIGEDFCPLCGTQVGD